MLTDGDGFSLSSYCLKLCDMAVCPVVGSFKYTRDGAVVAPLTVVIRVFVALIWMVLQ